MIVIQCFFDLFWFVIIQLVGVSQIWKVFGIMSICVMVLYVIGQKEMFIYFIGLFVISYSFDIYGYVFVEQWFDGCIYFGNFNCMLIN